MNRWIVYFLSGLFFGVFDFYYQKITAGIGRSFISWLLVAWTIWLVPAIPIILYEIKRTKSKLKATFATAFTWASAIVSYYFYLAVELIFIGKASRAEMHISNYKEEWYWLNIKGVFLGDVLRGISRWIGVAVVGGFAFGFLFSAAVLRFKKAKLSKG